MSNDNPAVVAAPVARVRVTRGVARRIWCRLFPIREPGDCADCGAFSPYRPDAREALCDKHYQDFCVHVRMW